jgi:hypothetical protein
LNGTITEGIRVKSVLDDDGRLGWVGYRITQRQPFPGEPMPIALGGSKPRCWLYAQHTLRQDDEGYLTVQKSTVALHLGSDPDSDPLFHYDYNREPATPYPEAHVQVPGASPTLKEHGQRFGREWELGQLHFPVGDRRFRPCLEDVVEFLVVEKFVEARSGWRQTINRSRAGFHRIQLAAAVRSDPQTAQETIEKLADAEPPGRKTKAPRRRRR